MLGSEHLNMLNRSSIQYDIYIEKYMYVAAHTTPSAKSTILRFPKGNAQKNPDIEGVVTVSRKKSTKSSPFLAQSEHGSIRDNVTD